MITIDSADKALKSYYLDVVSNSLNTKINPLLAKFEQTSADVWGKEVRKVVSNGINGGFGAGTETGDLPAASKHNYQQMVLTLKNLYGTIEVTDKAVRAAAGNSGAFLSLLENEMENLIRSAKLNFGRMLFGDGKGILGNVSAVSGNVLTLDSVKGIFEGMIVDVVSDDSDSVVVGGRRVGSVDRTNKKIVLEGAVIATNTIAEGNYVTVQGSYENELTGLGAIFGTDSTLYGIDRDTHKWLKPYTKTSTTITDAVIQGVIDTVEENSGYYTDMLVCSAGVKRAYIDYLVTNRTNVEYMQLDDGTQAISYQGIPMVSDRFCPSKTMYALHTPSFRIYQLCDWRWLEGDDGKVLKQIGGKPVYNATLVKYADILCERPNAQGSVTNITEA